MATGAIMLFAVTATVAGVSIDVVGIILMVVGAVGLLISLFATEDVRRRPPA